MSRLGLRAGASTTAPCLCHLMINPISGYQRNDPNLTVKRGRPLKEPTRATAAVHPCGLTRDFQELDRVIVQNVTVNTTARIDREA